MLHPDHFYHIYNHANGNENLFREEKNYYFFLKKANLYLTPYLRIYAYCLMPNHFHLLISVKSETDIKALFATSGKYNKLSETEQNNYIYKKISKSFANLCSSYTQAVNKVYQRRGSLFMPNFKSNPVEQDLHFCTLVHYIHANPVHHRFISDLGKWKFSSYNSFLVEKETALEREYVLSMFGGKTGFLKYHSQSIPFKNKWHDM
jgi:REP element-mobilizing transposase RayT